MPAPGLLVCVLMLAGSAGAQIRLAAPVEIRLEPASFGTGTPGAMPLTTTAISPLSPPALTALSGAPVLLTPSIVTVAPTVAPVLKPVATEQLPSDSTVNAGGMKRMRAVLEGARNWLLKTGPVVDESDPKVDAPETVFQNAREEIVGLRERRLSRTAYREYVRKESAAALARMTAALGAGTIGIRFSRDGGKPRDYRTPGQSLYAAVDKGYGDVPLIGTRRSALLSVFVVGNAVLAPPVKAFGATAKKLGLRRLSRDEETLATIRFLEAAFAGGPAGEAARRHAAVTASPLLQIPWSFKLKDGDFYYHGTTLEDLIRVVESGGAMAPKVSQYSIRAADSIMYASGRRVKLALPDNPAVLLQFGYGELNPLVSADMFKADVLAAASASYFSLHSAYVAATKPVPLSLMTKESKESLLAFLRAQETRRPDQPKWADLRAKFELVLDAAPK